MELIGVKFGPNGLIWPELWPVKVLQIGARKWALQSCSGHNWPKIFTASFFRAFLVKISLLLEQSVSPVGRQTPFLAKIGLFRQKCALQSCSGHFRLKILAASCFSHFFGQDKRTPGACRSISKTGDAILCKNRSRDAARVSARDARTDARSSHVTFQIFKGLSCLTD